MRINRLFLGAFLIALFPWFWFTSQCIVQDLWIAVESDFSITNRHNIAISDIHPSIESIKYKESTVTPSWDFIDSVRNFPRTSSNLRSWPSGYWDYQSEVIFMSDSWSIWWSCDFSYIVSEPNRENDICKFPERTVLVSEHDENTIYYGFSNNWGIRVTHDHLIMYRRDNVSSKTNHSIPKDHRIIDVYLENWNSSTIIHVLTLGDEWVWTVYSYERWSLKKKISAKPNLEVFGTLFVTEWNYFIDEWSSIYAFHESKRKTSHNAHDYWSSGRVRNTNLIQDQWNIYVATKFKDLIKFFRYEWKNDRKLISEYTLTEKWTIAEIISDGKGNISMLISNNDNSTNKWASRLLRYSINNDSREGFHIAPELDNIFVSWSVQKNRLVYSKDWNALYILINHQYSLPFESSIFVFDANRKTILPYALWFRETFTSTASIWLDPYGKVYHFGSIVRDGKRTHALTKLSCGWDETQRNDITRVISASEKTPIDTINFILNTNIHDNSAVIVRLKSSARSTKFVMIVAQYLKNYTIYEQKQILKKLVWKIQEAPVSLFESLDLDRDGIVAIFQLSR